MNQVLPHQPTWSARLSVHLAQINDQTKLTFQKHSGPLRVQKHFPQADGSCHIYILHPPGGLVGGDSLSVEIIAAANTHTVVTSPSAGKAYRCAENALDQSVVQVIDVGEKAHLEWLPQETIFFEGAKAKIDNRVSLHTSSSYLGWEIQTLGRRASGENFSQGSIEQTSQIWRDEKRCHRERLQVSDANRHSAWGLNGASVLGTLVAIPKEDQQIGTESAILALRTLLPEPCWGVTLRGCTVLVRYLGDCAENCRAGFEQARLLLIDSAIFNGSTEGYEPRIWKT